MPAINDVIRGALKLNGLPERVSFRSWKEFVESLPKLLSVEVPRSVSGMVIGRNLPTEDDKDKIWFRRDSGGNFIGIYAHQNGAWRPFFNFAENEIVWTVGDSETVPFGFVLIEDGDAVLPADVVRSIRAQYVPNQSGGFAYYALRFQGY